MSNQIFAQELISDNSDSAFQVPLNLIPSLMNNLVPDLEEIVESKEEFPYYLTWIKPLEISGREFSVLIIPQATGQYVARASTSGFNATGQGRTEEEAVQDIRSAIETLLEEEAHPSGDVEWPEDFL